MRLRCVTRRSFTDRWRKPYLEGKGHLSLLAVAKLRKATISLVMSVCLPAWNNSSPTGRILIKFNITPFFEILSRKSQVHYNFARITDALHEDRYKILIIFRSLVCKTFLLYRRYTTMWCTCLYYCTIY